MHSMEWSVGVECWSGVKFWSEKVGYFAIHVLNILSGRS